MKEQQATQVASKNINIDQRSKFLLLKEVQVPKYAIKSASCAPAKACSLMPKQLPGRLPSALVHTGEDFQNVEPSGGCGSFLCCGRAMYLYLISS